MNAVTGRSLVAAAEELELHALGGKARELAALIVARMEAVPAWGCDPSRMRALLTEREEALGWLEEAADRLGIHPPHLPLPEDA